MSDHCHLLIVQCGCMGFCQHCGTLNGGSLASGLQLDGVVFSFAFVSRLTFWCNIVRFNLV